MRQRHRRQLLARACHEFCIGPCRRTDLAAAEQAVEVLAQGLARAGVAQAGRLGIPVGQQVGAQRRGIEVRAAEQHQIRLQRLVARHHRTCALGGQTLLQPLGQARHEAVAQQMVVRVGRGSRDVAALLQPKRGGAAWRGLDGLARDRPHAIEQRNQRGHVIGRCRLDRRHLRLQSGVGVAHLGQHVGVARVLVPGPHERTHRQQAAGRDHAAVQPRALPFPALVGAGQARLAQHHVAQQARHEIRAAARPARRQHAVRQAERARQGAESAVDRRALLRGAGEVHAAQQRRGAHVAGLERGTHHLHHGVAQHAPLLRKAEQRGAALAVAFVLQARDQRFVERLFERDQFVGQARQAGRHVGVSIQRQGGAPHLRAFILVEVGKELGEAGQQVALGDHHIDRKADAELAVQFFDALAHLARQHAALVCIGLQQVGGAQRQDHAVDRLARPVLQQQAKKAEPRGAIGIAIAVLRGVAARGVDQHRVGREPPVAIARAAGAAQGFRSELGGQRKLQTRVDDGGGLAGTGRADHDVPGQLVHIRRALQPAERGLGAADAPAAQHLHRLCKTLADRRHLGRAGRRWGVGSGLGQQAVDHAAVAPRGGGAAPYRLRHEHQQDHRDRDRARAFAGQRRDAVEANQRTGEPHQRPGRIQAERDQQRAQVGGELGAHGRQPA